MNHNELMQRAHACQSRAHAPYSGIHVGAALLAVDGSVFEGCNVENASYGLTICAERVAACTAVAAGVLDWKAIAIISDEGFVPCGACRQFLHEFVPQLEVLVAHTATPDQWIERSLSEYLPHAFGQ